MMEIKKTKAADLERGRIQRFLLGLIVALSIVFVALEWTENGSSDSFTDSFLDDIAQDMEFMPVMMQEDMAEIPVEEKTSEPEKINIVENDAVASDNYEIETSEAVSGSDDMDDHTLASDDNMAETLSPVVESAPLDFRVVEDIPQFPGGTAGFMKWLTGRLRYPRQAREDKLQGTVLATFIINEDGKVSDIKIARSLSPDCDREVLRVLRMMPEWTPGVQNDKPCRTKVCIPIVFRM
ncbi:energy transducer TonB [Xylanibacter muris]|uniref:Energy transducer TonB n=2 Tax=Xylanibacter muris TaxID=2736290 RepID=A0ABX2ASK6_9BACT|nr:energy transducer TonB [Xylanibacter muris]NPD93190.1 energy transducer TonB [Xylanibacter muris]